MAHDCPDCGGNCYCDMEDHHNETSPDDCRHQCPPDNDPYDDEGDYETDTSKEAQ